MEKQYVGVAEAIKTICDSCANDYTCTRVSDLIALVHDIPTAKVAPVVESEWIERMDWDGEFFYDCQKCGGTISSFDGNSADILYKFCPYCGARMRGIKYLPSKTDEE